MPCAFRDTTAPWKRRSSSSERALKQIQPDMPSDEAGLLNAFDRNRKRIYDTAAKVYERGRKGSYDLLPEDF